MTSWVCYSVSDFHSPTVQTQVFVHSALAYSWIIAVNLLLVPRTVHYLTSFKCGFLNIFSRQNLPRSLSHLLFLPRWNKCGAKNCLKNHIPFDFWDDSTLASQEAGKTIEKPLKELLWSQQLVKTLSFVSPPLHLSSCTSGDCTGPQFLSVGLSLWTQYRNQASFTNGSGLPFWLYSPWKLHQIMIWFQL